MTTRDRKNIALTSREKSAVERIKKSYDRKQGSRSDWGDFLVKALPFALLSLGIYELAKMQRNKPQVICPDCSKEFTVAIAADMPHELVLVCPHCGIEMMVEVSDGEGSG